MGAYIKILLVDDDEAILELLAYNLKKENYVIETASNGKKALELAHIFLPDIIIMDVMMPEMDGIRACRLIRKEVKKKQIHILFLTARSDENAEVAALDEGADDYISKPIKIRALLKRIEKVIMQKNDLADMVVEEQILKVGKLSINKSAYEVSHKGKTILLPKKEFELLYFLAENPGKVFSREALLKKIWGNDIIVLDRTVDVHIRRIRTKIGDKFIKTIKGIGYKFVER